MCIGDRRAREAGRHRLARGRRRRMHQGREFADQVGRPAT